DPRRMRFARRAFQPPGGLDGRDDEPPRPPRGGRPDPPCPRPGRPAGRQDRAHRRREACVDGLDERTGSQGGPRRLGADEARADAAELAAAQADARTRALAVTPPSRCLAPAASATGASPRERCGTFVTDALRWLPPLPQPRA